MSGPHICPDCKSELGYRLGEYYCKSCNYRSSNPDAIDRSSLLKKLNSSHGKARYGVTDVPRGKRRRKGDET